MLDDYVNRAADTAANNIPAVNFQGFETSSGPIGSNEQGILRAFDSPQNAPNSALGKSTKPLPIFGLGRVEFPEGIPSRISAVAVSNDVLSVAFANNVIFILEMQRAEKIIKLDLPKKADDITVNKLFLHPTGKYLLINSLQGESWYWAWGWKRPKSLKRFNGYKLIIDSIAWDRRKIAISSSEQPSTGEFLIGTRTGAIYEALLGAGDDFLRFQEERFVRHLFTLPENQAISGLAFEFFPPSDISKCLIIVTTPSRIYQFAGVAGRHNSDSFTPIFSKFKETPPEMLELPGCAGLSQLYFRNFSPSRADSLPSALAWSTGQGVYHGKLNFDTFTNDFVDGAELLPYPDVHASHTNSPHQPIVFAVTHFHYIFLYSDRFVAVSDLDQNVAHEELLLLQPQEIVQGLAVDHTRSTYWIYTNTSMFEVLANNEDRDVWLSFLQRQSFQNALAFAKTPYQINKILEAQAQTHMDEGRYCQAADIFAKTGVSFEDIVIRLVNSRSKKGLMRYLVARLDQTRKSDASVRMALASWVTELYLESLDILEDAIVTESSSINAKTIEYEMGEHEAQFRVFLANYASSLDKSTTYELFQSRGKAQFMLHFAELVGDSERVIDYWIAEEQWSKAVQMLKRNSDPLLYYKYSGILLQNSPTEIVDAWMKLSSLDPQLLFPAMLQSLHFSAAHNQSQQIVRYLEHLIFDARLSVASVHDLLLTIYVTSKPKNETALLRYLALIYQDLPNPRPIRDLDYTLRLCSEHGLIQACVQIYSLMGHWEECVDLALSNGELDLAKLNADKPGENASLRKKLWLKIAKYVVEEKKDIKSAMLFLDTAAVLKIEDILPLFPDFVVIDDFKEEICKALEGYGRHIGILKQDMDVATANVNSIKDEIAKLGDHFITLDNSQQCTLCGDALLMRQFYVYPCQHIFHADCLINLFKISQPASILRRMVALQTDLMILRPPISEAPGQVEADSAASRNLLSSSFAPGTRAVVSAAENFGRGVLTAGDRLRDLIAPESLANAIASWGGTSNARLRSLTREDRNKEKSKADLQGLLESQCPLCDSVITQLEKPFLHLGDCKTDWEI